jgi:hypothetical protein
MQIKKSDIKPNAKFQVLLPLMEYIKSSICFTKMFGLKIQKVTIGHFL